MRLSVLAPDTCRSHLTRSLRVLLQDVLDMSRVECGSPYLRVRLAKGLDLVAGVHGLRRADEDRVVLGRNARKMLAEPNGRHGNKGICRASSGCLSRAAGLHWCMQDQC